MPTHIRAPISWQVGSALPRDAVQVTPCFRHQQVLAFDAIDWQNLANDLLAAIQGWVVAPTARQTTVRLYQIGEPPPNRPKAIAVANPGVNAEANYPREVATCLSFYGGQNAPHNRGRLYLPHWSYNSGAPGTRPSVTERDKIKLLPDLFAGLGGVDVDWIVWSPTKGAATKVTNWWIDDEYDTQRRRGLKPTTRTAGTTGG